MESTSPQEHYTIPPAAAQAEQEVFFMKLYIKLPGEGEIVFEKEPGNGDWLWFFIGLAGIAGMTTVFVTMFSSF